MKYYLVSYSHSRGLGNMFFKSEPYLDISDAEKQISAKCHASEIVIIAINEIEEGQFLASNRYTQEEL